MNDPKDKPKADLEWKPEDIQILKRPDASAKYEWSKGDVEVTPPPKKEDEDEDGEG